MSAARRKAGAAKPAPIFAALGDQTRLHLLARLSSEAPLSIAHLTTDSNVSRQAVTKHLHILAKAGLVRRRRRGREQLYEPNIECLNPVHEYLDTVSRQWDDALSRLKLLVED